MDSEQNAYGTGFLVYTDKLIAKAKSCDDIAYNQARSKLSSVSGNIAILSSYGNAAAGELNIIYARAMASHNQCRKLCEAAILAAREYEAAEDTVLV